MSDEAVAVGTERLSLDEFFFALALCYSTRGTCDRLRTATIIVDRDNRIIGAGYNGGVAETENCDEAGHLLIDGHCKRTLHGEANALSGIDKHQVVGGTAYVIGTPCIDCIKALLQIGTRQADGHHRGLSRICYLGSYGNALGNEFIKDLANKKGVRLEQVLLDIDRLFKRITAILSSQGGAIYMANMKKNAMIKEDKGL